MTKICYYTWYETSWVTKKVKSYENDQNINLVFDQNFYIRYETWMVTIFAYCMKLGGGPKFLGFVRVFKVSH